MISRIAHTLFVLMQSTFIENVRDKVLYGIWIFAFIFSTFTLFLGSISLGENLHIVRSLGLAGMYLFGLLITIFLATSLVFKELERKTAYFILSKPVSRWQMVVGKFSGLLASVAVSVAGMLAVYLGLVWYGGGGVDTGAMFAVGYELLELGLIIALAIFFSTFARPLASTVYTIVCLYIGHSLSLLPALSAPAALQPVLTSLYYILPNLEKFNVRELVLYGGVPTTAHMLTTVAYAVLYAGVLLFGASLLLGKREL